MRIKFICAAIALSIVSTGASAHHDSAGHGNDLKYKTIATVNNISKPKDADRNGTSPLPTPTKGNTKILGTYNAKVTSDPQAGKNTVPKPALQLENGNYMDMVLSPISDVEKGDTTIETPDAEPYNSGQKFEEAAKKKAAESYYRDKSDKANAAKKQAAIDNARRFLSILTAEEAAAKIKAANGEEKNKGREEQALIDDAFSVFDITAEEAAAKIKAANGEEKNKGREEQALIDDAFSVFDITAEEAAAKIKAAEDEAMKQTTKKDSSYILTNESLKAMLGPLMDMLGPLLIQYPQLANIIANFKNIKIEKLTDVTEYKIITMGGIVKTIHCNSCTWHSATLQGLRIGRDMGMPLDIFNAIYDEFGGESIIKKSDMRILIISIWKNLENVMAKAMADPNFDIANAMTKKQIQQIQLQAGSIDNSGGSAGGNDHHHDEGHHEEAM